VQAGEEHGDFLSWRAVAYSDSIQQTKNYSQID